MSRIIIGGVLGGLVLFVWGAIAHLPPVGTAGERSLSPQEGDAVLGGMRGSMKERALYVLPGMEEKQAWLAKFEAGPAAVVAYNPHPAEQAFAGSPFASWMLIELVADLIAGIMGAVIAANLSSALRFWPRVLVLASIGLIATVDIDVSYWNWFAFPTNYLLAQFVDHGGGWLMAGLVLARIKPAAPPR
jgi:hypothetical protein